MTRADELIEVMCKDRFGDDWPSKGPNAQASADRDEARRAMVRRTIFAIEAAGYVIGKMEWDEFPEANFHRLFLGRETVAEVTASHEGKWFAWGIGVKSASVIDSFATEAEARAACEASVRKTMVGE